MFNDRQKKFPEVVQKEILKQLVEGAPDSALAKHKKRVRKQHILQQTSNGSDAPCIWALYLYRTMQPLL